MLLDYSHTIDGAAEFTLSIRYSCVEVVMQTAKIVAALIFISRKITVQVCNAPVNNSMGQQPLLCSRINKVVPITLMHDVPTF